VILADVIYADRIKEYFQLLLKNAYSSITYQYISLISMIWLFRTKAIRIVEIINLRLNGNMGFWIDKH